MQLPQISSIQLGESAYPELLARSPNPPRVLYIVGNRESLPGNCVSVVGSRKSTRYGERVVDWMVPTLVKSGLTIVSGLAYGIDALAHKYALEGGGRCVAVLGSGLDIIYPSAHRRLFLDIIEAGGCIVSEYPPGTPPLPHHFPQRNRIVAGLSKVVLIVEATSKSGTLSTANWAVEAGRDVCVVPGSIFEGTSEGVHALLKQGQVRIATRPEDVLEAYQDLQLQIIDRIRPSLTGSMALVYDVISQGAEEVELIADRAGVSIPSLQSILSVLELDGYIDCKSNKWQKTL